MEYIALDIETGGIEMHYSIIEVGLVRTDSHQPPPGEMCCARIVVIADGGYVCSPWAAINHRRLWDEIERARRAQWWQDAMLAGSTYVFVRPGEPESSSNYPTIYVREGFEYQALAEALTRIGCEWRGQSIVVGGKNVARFDLPRLEAHGWLAPHDNGERIEVDGMPEIRIKHRCFDPCMLWLRAEDEEPPDLATCMERAGLEGEVPHDAVDDAKLAAKCIFLGLTRE